MRLRHLSALGLFALLGACAIPTQETAEPLEGLPEDLLVVTTSTTTPVDEDQDEQTFELSLFWHADEGRLARVVRTRTTAPTIAEALTELVAGPTPEEVSAIPGVEFLAPDPGLTDIDLAPTVSGPDAGIVTITVADDAGFRDLDNKQNAAAELVCTLAQFDTITGVVVRDSQPNPIVLPGINAEPIDGAADPSHFGDCAGINAEPPG